MTTRWTRVPPAGDPIAWACLGRALARDSAAARAERLGAALAPLLPGARLQLHASGREALRALLAWLAGRSGRDEVLLPAYTCFSVASAAVAAGLRVRLVDVDDRGALDAEDLAAQPLDRAAAVLVSNLYGVPEPIEAVRRLAAAAGVAVIDDAAQSLGAADAGGHVGTRGDFGLLSFGRGKPLSALGGGALVLVGDDAPPAPPLPTPDPLRVALRGLAWNAALRPLVFRAASALPRLHVGETRFDPSFARGGIPGAALALADALAPDLGAACEARQRRGAALARELGSDPRYRPITAAPDAHAVHPRLAVRATDRRLRDRALRAARDLGASPSYPTALDAVEALASARPDSRKLRRARALAERIFTLPTHDRMTESACRTLAARLRAL